MHVLAQLDIIGHSLSCVSNNNTVRCTKFMFLRGLTVVRRFIAQSKNESIFKKNHVKNVLTQTGRQFGMLPTTVLRILYLNNTVVLVCQRGPTLEKTIR